MKFKVSAPEQRKALEEIVLSKTTFNSSAPMHMAQRLWWLKYELPASLSLTQIVPLALPTLCVCPIMVFCLLFPGRPIAEALIHPDFLLMVSLLSLVFCLVPMSIVCVASLLYLVNPKEFLNLWQFPDLLRVRSDILELRWTKTPVQASVGLKIAILIGNLTGKKPQIRIPWHWIASVNVRDYLYMGILPQKVLEIDLKEIPADYSEWQLLEKVSRDGTFYFDPATQKLARKFALGGIRLPLPLFAFSSDVNLLLENIKLRCGAEALGDVSLLEENSSQIESYTCLWLEELNSKGTINSQRQLQNDTTLQNGAYKVSSVLGSGGLSVVYQARETQAYSEGHAGNDVAIKEILCNFSGTKRSVENNLKQILSEVSMLRMLEHPNIVKYRTSFAEGSRLYIVMDLVNGCNLRQYALSNPPLKEQELLSLVRQCCSILDYLHSQNPPIVHRDFTPDNLMISEDILKLVDFNIAQAAVTNSSQTVMGKHCFMAPEQFCGEASVLSDLYQLGTTIFFIATATDPEPLTSCDLQMRRPDLSSELNLLVRKLTEREPLKRFTSANDVLKKIESFASPGTLQDEAS